MFASVHLNQYLYRERPVDVHNSFSKLKYGILLVTGAAFSFSKFRLNVSAMYSCATHP